MVAYDGIRAKIARVRIQLASLEDDMGKVCRDIAKSITHEILGNEQVWIYRGKMPVAPIEWSIKAGEILYHLRSTLDHLVWQLILSNGNSPERKNGFPIVKEECDWGRSAGKLEGVTPRVESIIKNMQPYTGGIGLPFNVMSLWELNSLCNIDKHRYLAMTVICSSGPNPMIFGHNQPPVYNSPSRPPLRGTAHLGKIESNKILFRINDVKAKINPSFRMDVRFDSNIEESGVNNYPVPSILNGCFGAVERVIHILAKETSGIG